ncbi:MAG TPA: asparagine synthase (glutamine-hydrolyzing) [Candidatus Baltobacteraceae bacterium]|nr:asparagine synthase (glutamine-hydrolyzing) [Candidatus Baltobacteraceae bacterium]
MCGICGVIAQRGTRVEPEAVLAMNHEIAHRGPDDEGVFTDGNCGLAMRRLSIIDVASGHQPMANANRSLWIVYNGEIYNHRELRRDLEALGHTYRTKSDTETILHLYEEYGEDCVTRLQGMFAFAIWDSRRRRLFAARDRLGIKPFYYLFERGLFLFASEIKAILAYPAVSREFDRGKLAEYLAFGYVSGEGTMFSGINRLAAGHTLELQESGVPGLRRYWDLPEYPQMPALSHRSYVQTYREMLEESVSSHLMSDVPLGVFLSGGLDSSAVAALATKIRGGPVQTFSVGYDEDAYSELPYARTMAYHLRSEHHEVRVSREGFFDALPGLIWQEDEPLAWTSSVSLYFVARLAREHVKVVLTGEGSDETLAGYERYAYTLLNARLDPVYRAVTPSVLRGWLRDQIGTSRKLGAKLARRLRHTFLGRDGASWESLYFDNFYSAFSSADQESLLTPQARLDVENPYACALAYWGNASGDLVHKMLYTDIKTYLHELLMKQDQMSMAASIESRVPFLDHKLVEFTARIPHSSMIRGMAGKQVLKDAMADLLPASIIHRRKMGFPTPWAHWLAGAQLDGIESLLLDPQAVRRGLFEPQALRQLFEEHRRGFRDHATAVWRLLNLELWHRVFIDGAAPQNDPSRGADLSESLSLSR